MFKYLNDVFYLYRVRHNSWKITEELMSGDAGLHEQPVVFYHPWGRK